MPQCSLEAVECLVNEIRDAKFAKRRLNGWTMALGASSARRFGIKYSSRKEPRRHVLTVQPVWLATAINPLNERSHDCHWHGLEKYWIDADLASSRDARGATPLCFFTSESTLIMQYLSCRCCSYRIAIPLDSTATTVNCYSAEAHKLDESVPGYY